MLKHSWPQIYNIFGGADNSLEPSYKDWYTHPLKLLKLYNCSYMANNLKLNSHNNVKFDFRDYDIKGVPARLPSTPQRQPQTPQVIQMQPLPQILLPQILLPQEIDLLESESELELELEPELELELETKEQQYIRILEHFTSSKSAPSIDDFIQQVVTISKCSVYVMWLTDVYINRIKHICPVLTINVNTVQYLYMTALLLAMKYNEDDYYTPTTRQRKNGKCYDVEMNINVFYAKILNISVQKMNELELCFCELINFDFYVHKDHVDEVFPIDKKDKMYVDIYNKENRFEADQDDQLTQIRQYAKSVKIVKVSLKK